MPVIACVKRCGREMERSKSVLFGRLERYELVPTPAGSSAFGLFFDSEIDPNSIARFVGERVQVTIEKME